MYERLEQLGKGSFSTVYRGRRVFTGQFVSLKVIPTAKKSPEELAALRCEVEILRRLDHPSIIGLLDVLETPAELTLVTELAQGELLEVLLEDGALPDAVVRSVAAQLTSALAYLHARGVVHRDLKPQNVLVAAGGRVKLCDFGFAREIPSFLMSSIKGTPLYVRGRAASAAPLSLPHTPHNRPPAPPPTPNRWRPKCFPRAGTRPRRMCGGWACCCGR